MNRARSYTSIDRGQLWSSGNTASVSLWSSWGRGWSVPSRASLTAVLWNVWTNWELSQAHQYATCLQQAAPANEPQSGIATPKLEFDTAVKRYLETCSTIFVP